MCCFLLHLSHVVSFCGFFATSACLYLELVHTGRHPVLPGGFGATSAPPKKIKSPKFVPLQGFSACAIFTLGVFGIL